MRFVALALCLSTVACSQLFVQSPPSAPRNQYFNCTERPVGPIIDAVLAAGLVTLVGVVAVQDGLSEDNGFYGAPHVALAGLFGWSAWDGARDVRRCRAARRRFAR